VWKASNLLCVLGKKNRGDQQQQAHDFATEMVEEAAELGATTATQTTGVLTGSGSASKKQTPVVDMETDLKNGITILRFLSIANTEGIPFPHKIPLI